MKQVGSTGPQVPRSAHEQVNKTMTNATLNNLQRVGLHFNVFVRRIRFLIVPLSGYYFDEQLKLQVMHQNTEKIDRSSVHFYWNQLKGSTVVMSRERVGLKNNILKNISHLVGYFVDCTNLYRI